MLKRRHRKHGHRSESRQMRARDDYDRVWAYEAADEQARWDEAQDSALRESAERFDREQGQEVP